MSLRGTLLSAAIGVIAGAGCRSPSPTAPTPTPVGTVAIPASSVDIPPDPEPAASPWEQLMALQAVFTGGAPEPPCPAEQNAVVLVTAADDEAGRMDLAEKAGCAVRPPESTVEIRLCCPAGLEMPSALRTGGGKSCEQAQQEYVANYDAEKVKDGPPDMSAGVYGAVLNRGQYLNACGVKDTSGVTVCVAVQDGRVKGVTVRTTPATVEMGDCIAREVRGMAFPAHPRMDITRTTFTPSE